MKPFEMEGVIFRMAEVNDPEIWPVVEDAPRGNVVAPVHPFWCDECGGHAGFTIRGCPIEHADWCSRRDEDPEVVYRAAVSYVKATGKEIP